jgi:putative oxygen-independent coproporphyrinogen III oxidase
VTDPQTDSGFGIYVHWPFCLSKCPYCDFNSHVRDSIDEDRWRKALLRELDTVAETTTGRTVTSVFFGGGTPSLMPPAIVAALLDRIAEHWTVDKNVEITLEANPTSVESSRFQAFRTAGVNRASLGVQALDDSSLKFLGREHGVAEARAAVALAQRIFPRYSFDLIYARPDQTVAAWRNELRDALAMAADHISLYQLTIEPGTVFHTKFRRGDFPVPDANSAAGLFEATQEILGGAGMPAYEVSNHAAPGAEGRHNLVYWRYQDYIGVGPGAHGRVTANATKWATSQFRNPDSWLNHVEETGSGMESRDALDASERLTEVMIMGLRLSEGVPESRLRAETGQGFDAAFDPAHLDALTNEGLLRLEMGRLSATPAGRQRLNAVLDYLLP